MYAGTAVLALTSVPVAMLEPAWERVKWHRARWMDRRGLSSRAQKGCILEQRQLQSSEGMCHGAGEMLVVVPVGISRRVPIYDVAMFG